MQEIWLVFEKQHGRHRSDQVLDGIRHNNIMNMGSVLEVELVEAGGAPTGVGATPSSTFYSDYRNYSSTGLESQDAWHTCFRSSTCHHWRSARSSNDSSLSRRLFEGHIPAMHPEDYLMPADKNGSRICQTTFKDCDPDNTIGRHKIHSTCGIKIPGKWLNSTTKRANSL